LKIIGLLPAFFSKETLVPSTFQPLPMEGTTQQAAAQPCTLDQYDMVGVIGKGSFGTVSRIRRKADGRIMVWKELNYGNMREKEKQLVVSEVRFMALVHISTVAMAM